MTEDNLDEERLDMNEDDSEEECLDADEMEEEEDEPQPALVINFYSWATPVIGLVMLALGLVGGYFLRPAITQSLAGAAPTAVAAAPQTPAADSSQPADAQNAPSAADRQEMMDFLIGQAGHIRGDAGAPVVMIEFSDFQCPYCGKYATESGSQINENYVKSGEVQIIYWHFPFLGPESQWAAEASECAGEQDAFWEYYDYLFALHGEGEREAYTKENLKKFAEALKLDAKSFGACLDSGKYTEVVQSQANIARQIGVQSTPTFLINGQPMLGAQPFEAFKQLIDQELAAKKQ